MEEPELPSRVECVTTTEVMEMVGLSRWTVNRRLNALGIPVYRDGDNRRIRLIRKVDVARLTAPVLEERRHLPRGTETAR